MKKGQPSTTARRVALGRAAHQVIDHPRVFEDPIAVRIVDSQALAALAVPNSDENGRMARYVRASVVARSRFAEEELAIAVARGTRQCVVLGAGMDTFAYRNPHPQLRVFEVDHPSTQASKREQLARAGIDVPTSLTFVPVDFETQALGAALQGAGFDAGAPAFFSWLGVTMYLEPSTVMATLKTISQGARGSQVVFDYVIPLAQHTFARRIAYRLLMARLAMVGEPWKCLFDPAALDRELTAMGFLQREDLGYEAINARYFAGRTDRLAVGPGGHLVSAKV